MWAIGTLLFGYLPCAWETSLRFLWWLTGFKSLYQISISCKQISMLVFLFDHLSWHRVGLNTGTKCILETLSCSTWSCQYCTSWSQLPTWRSCPLQLERGCAVLRLLILIHFEGECYECEVFGGVWRHQPTFAIRWHLDNKEWIVSLEWWSRVWTWSLRVLLGVLRLGW